MRRRLTLIWLVLLVMSGCGRGYEGENRAIVGELPVLDEAVLLGDDHHGYCSGDTCLFGNDRSSALLMYSVDRDRYTQDSSVEAYRQGL